MRQLSQEVADAQIGLNIAQRHGSFEGLQKTKVLSRFGQGLEFRINQNINLKMERVQTQKIAHKQALIKRVQFMICNLWVGKSETFLGQTPGDNDLNRLCPARKRVRQSLA